MVSWLVAGYWLVGWLLVGRSAGCWLLVGRLAGYWLLVGGLTERSLTYFNKCALIRIMTLFMHINNFIRLMLNCWAFLKYLRKEWYIRV